MTLKRSREEVAAEAEVLAMANCLVLLSRPEAKDKKTPLEWDFECKTCKKKFPSFQALGGHRASHKRPKIDLQSPNDGIIEHPKKRHLCSICGLEFAMGQALGGHMRKHRTDEQHTDDNKTADLLTKEEDDERKDKKVVLFDLNLTPLENDLMVAGRVAMHSSRTLNLLL